MNGKTAYAKDITYATNNELGFDYLARQHAVWQLREKTIGSLSIFSRCKVPLPYAIVDEVDNILIDEARTPLIISGPAHQDIGKYSDADRVARGLKKDEHFTVNEKDHTVNLTDDGVRAAEKLAGVESFYTAGNMEWPHMIDNALKASFPVQTRCQLRRQGQFDHHRRRLHWTPYGRSSVERRPCTKLSRPKKASRSRKKLRR